MLQRFMMTDILPDDGSERGWGKYMTGTIVKGSLGNIWGFEGDATRQIKMLRGITAVMRNLLLKMVPPGKQVNEWIVDAAFAALTMQVINSQLLEGNIQRLSVYS
jgi:hypothetical protein